MKCKTIAFCLISACLLQACIGVVLVGVGALIGGVVVYEGRNFDTKQADHKLTSEINKRLNADPDIHQKARIIVSAYDGVVLLAGQTPTEAMREQVATIAQSVPGSKRIYNEITVSGPISSITQSSDSWITTKIKSHLLTTKGLDSSQIKVITENGTVYLLGKTTREQAKIAANTARQVAGVQKVVTLFQYPQ